MSVLTNDSLRELERTSIRAFLESHLDLLRGRVLDYGCGKMPYREIVESTGAEYCGFDRRSFPANVSGRDISPGRIENASWEVVMATQILQYTTDPLRMIAHFFRLLKPGGHLVLTGATTWPVVEDEDLMRLTPAGIRHYATQAGFKISDLVDRASIRAGDVDLVVGYGLVAERASHLIYGLADPRTGQVRYVGKTSQSPVHRLRQHISNARTDKKQQRRLRHWIASLGDHDPKLVILEAGPVDVDKAERAWIGKFKNEGARLCNMTNGGDGRSRGYTITAEERRRRSERIVSPETCARISASNMGRRHTPESRAKMSVAAIERGSKLSDPQVLNIRASTEPIRILAERHGGYIIDDIGSSEWTGAIERAGPPLVRPIRTKKLCADDVRAIRASNASDREIAEQFDINVFYVRRLRRGFGWTDAK